jgi:hypothetical protein
MAAAVSDVENFVRVPVNAEFGAATEHSAGCAQPRAWCGAGVYLHGEYERKLAIDQSLAKFWGNHTP